MMQILLEFEHARPRRVLLPMILLALVAGSCSISQSDMAPATTTARVQRASRPLEGVYTVCSGAYAHRESLVLRNGTFQHYIQSHGIYGNRSNGTYSMLGDTLVLNIQQEGPAPQGVQRPISLHYSFVIGEHAGFPVLWRGTDEARRIAAPPYDVSPYSALFYGGADPDHRQEPTCAAIHRGATR